MSSSWDYWSRYNPKRWKPFEMVDEAHAYLNYNGGGAEGRGIIRTYKSIIGTTKHRFESTDREVV